MTRANGALVAFLAAAAIGSVDGLWQPNRSIIKAAKETTAAVPNLRAAERGRKQRLLSKVRSFAVPKEAQEQSMNEGRELNNNNYGNYQQNNNGNSYYSNGYNNNDNNGNNREYYGDYGQYSYNNMNEQDFGFDISDYSMKYVGCSTVMTFDGGNYNQYYNQGDDDGNNYNKYYNYGQQAENVLTAKRFATFRLCPEDQCNSKSRFGCNGNNYGEYVVELDNFIEAVLEFNEERVNGYCQYCQKCAVVESFFTFYNDIMIMKSLALAGAQAVYKQWYQTYFKQQQQAQNQNGQQNEYNGQAEEYYNDAAAQYWEAMHNDNAYNYGGQQYSSGYQATEPDGSNRQLQYNNGQQQQYNNGQQQQYNNGQQQQYNNGQQQQQYNNGQQQQQSTTFWWQTNTNNADSSNQNWVTNEAFWDISSSSSTSSNQNNWQSMMQGATGSWFGKKIWNGYFQNGEFTEEWGYFDGFGEYQSLEDDKIVWDQTIWGYFPETWNEEWLDNVDQVQRCNAKYASSCVEQYDTCMALLGENWGYQQQGNNQGNNQGNDNYDGRNRMSNLGRCAAVNTYQSATYAQYNAYSEYAQNRYNAYQQNNEDNENNQNDQNNEAQAFNARGYYIGPTCEDNHDIKLAVYSDEDCTSLDKDITVEDILGYDPMADSATTMIPYECVNCGGDNVEWYENEWQEMDYGDEQQDQEYSQGDGAIEPICSMLYQAAGKCNQNLHPDFMYNNNYNYNQNNGDDDGANGDDAEAVADGYYWNEEDGSYNPTYLSYQQDGNEEKVCTFIKSLNSLSYNEFGEVTGGFGGWKAWNRDFQNKATYVSAGKKAALILTGLAAGLMGLAVAFLHGRLAKKNIPWRPKRQPGEDPTDLARQNSGIIAGRSSRSSGPAGSAPLL